MLCSGIGSWRRIWQSRARTSAKSKRPVVNSVNTISCSGPHDFQIGQIYLFGFRTIGAICRVAIGQFRKILWFDDCDGGNSILQIAIIWLLMHLHISSYISIIFTPCNQLNNSQKKHKFGCWFGSVARPYEIRRSAELREYRVDWERVLQIDWHILWELTGYSRSAVSGVNASCLP